MAPELVEQEVAGLVVVTQTCDVVRSCSKRPYVDVSPLVEVTEQDLALIKAGRSPQFAFIPGVSDLSLVADLDRTMAVEKSVLARWSRTAGWTTDAEIRSFADCLKRKSSRFAFPDDFAQLMTSLVKRIKDKHGKNSPEGLALAELGEIRVAAAPSWNAEKVQLSFIFMKLNNTTVSPEIWATHLQSWLGLVAATERYEVIEGRIVFLADITAEEYVESDLLDLDFLSG